MKEICGKILGNWRRIISAAAVLLIFLLPVTRSVLAKVVRSNTSSADKQGPVQENRGRGNHDSHNSRSNRNSHNSRSNRNSHGSYSYPSVSCPSSGTPVSPMSNTGPTTTASNSRGSGRHNNPKPKRK